MAFLGLVGEQSSNYQHVANDDVSLTQELNYSIEIPEEYVPMF